ncbi:ATP-binding protein [Mucilaginibacter sp. RS28]|uniref:histidine kinase n=1 Tax=Mucilaginibacter straminoryzae TaxID=2932774 RepID=A0A9X1X3J7_9SPHI|nr:hybrid sensor histidine kinase/response regulator transcription factor [Mucilaginibacter straminoryzae]MCJ8209008.1 ATP-binding protein [Mucilaginibacter straminoryzae]
MLFVFLCVFRTGKAQAKTLNFKHHTINQGLSQNTVLSVLCDSRGLTWVGTEDGLNKFDGYEFTTYRHDNQDPLSISGNQINAIFEDKSGDMWIGTANGLSRYDRDKDRFTRLTETLKTAESPQNYITSITADNAGDIWIGCLGNLKKYDSKRKRLITFQSKELQRIQSIFCDSKGMLWLCKQNGLVILDPFTTRILPLPGILVKDRSLSGSFIRTIREDKQGRVWIGTESRGIFIYERQQNKLVSLAAFSGLFNRFPVVSSVRDIFVRNEKEIWFGTRNGLLVYNILLRTQTLYTTDKYDPYSLSHNIVRCIAKDKAGNYWIGTYSGGLDMTTGKARVFNMIGEQFGDRQGLTSKVVNALAVGADSSLWVGMESEGLDHYDSKKNTFRNFRFSAIEPEASNTVKSLLRIGNDLWIGTLTHLWRMDMKTGAIIKCEIPVTGGVYSLEETPKGLWAGTNGSGVLLLRSSKIISRLSHRAGFNSIASDHVNKICRDKDQSLWIGTGAGLNYFDGKQFKLFIYDRNDPYSLSNSSVLSIFIDRRQGVWIGTKGGGLNFFDRATRRFYHITTREGLANDVIQDICEDKAGNLWVSSNKGLSKLTFKNFSIPFRAQNFNILNYDFQDGLQSNQFNPNSGATAPDGALFFGGINGISFFDPVHVAVNRYRPPVIFTDFLINNVRVKVGAPDAPLKQAIDQCKEVVLAHAQAYFSIKFAALNYINPSKNHYRYKLEGLTKNEDWHYVTSERSATYTSLDAGEYNFKVQASNDDGVWNEQAKTLKIIVLPPWWKTWWAFIIYATVMSVLLYLYYYYSLKTAKLKNELSYEHIVREKEQELYQQKLNFFTNISHEIKTPITLILAPLENLIETNQGNNKFNNQLMLMKRNGERLMKLITQLLDFRKFESNLAKVQVAEGNIVRFVKEVVYSFQAHAENLGIKIEVEAEQPRIRLWFDREIFEKILFNLISNALKFTPEGGTVLITLKKINDQKQLQIEVKDNGRGIPADQIVHIFDQFAHYDNYGVNLNGNGIGLNLVKTLVEYHKGTITVESQEGLDGKRGYTCFRFTVPMGKDQYKADEIISDYKSSEDIAAYQEKDLYLDAELITEQLAEPREWLEEKPILLIVEDNPDLITFLSDYFKNSFIVEVAVNGKEGIEKAFQLIPDIILSDIMMPEVSGTELCSTLKKDTRTSHIPIILLTARTPLIYKIEGFDTGADDYITKPFSVKLLERRVWNLLESRRKLRDRYKKEITLQPVNIAINSADELLLEKIMSLIERQIDNPKLSVEDLGKEVFMSRVTFYRKIKALTNQTPVEFIRGIRLKRAAQLLATKKYHISEVAYMVGFLDLNYFRKCFKEEFGKTPKDYYGAESDNAKS